MYVVVEELKILLRAIFGLRLKISRPPNFRSHNCTYIHTYIVSYAMASESPILYNIHSTKLCDDKMEPILEPLGLKRRYCGESFVLTRFPNFQ
jgi:hypothetical protein